MYNISDSRLVLFPLLSVIRRIVRIGIGRRRIRMKLGPIEFPPLPLDFIGTVVPAEHVLVALGRVRVYDLVVRVHLRGRATGPPRIDLLLLLALLRVVAMHEHLQLRLGRAARFAALRRRPVPRLPLEVFEIGQVSPLAGRRAGRGGFRSFGGLRDRFRFDAGPDEVFFRVHVPRRFRPGRDDEHVLLRVSMAWKRTGSLLENTGASRYLSRYS